MSVTSLCWPLSTHSIWCCFVCVRARSPLPAVHAACQRPADHVCSCAGFCLSSSSETFLVHGLGGKEEEEEEEGGKIKNKLINKQKERCLVQGDVRFQGCFPPRQCGVPSSPLCLHHQRAEDAAPHTFLEDELGSLLEVPLLCLETANSSGHHIDSQEKTEPLSRGFVPSSAGSGAASALLTW